jgi:hypothetical protein
MRQQLTQSLLSSKQRQKSSSSPSQSSQLSKKHLFIAAVAVAMLGVLIAWSVGLFQSKKSTSESTMYPSSKPLFNFFVSSTATPVV